MRQGDPSGAPSWLAPRPPDAAVPPRKYSTAMIRWIGRGDLHTSPARARGGVDKCSTILSRVVGCTKPLETSHPDPNPSSRRHNGVSGHPFDYTRLASMAERAA